jgi:hypothetical protein
MQTECVRCHKVIDTVQGYKFSATEYVCMSCYDEFKAERAARAKKQHKNPLIDQFGDSTTAPPTRKPRQPVVSRRQEPAAPPTSPRTPEPQPPLHEMPSVPPEKESVPAPPPTKAPPSAELCDVCKKPIPDFKIPLKGGKKVCMDCNGLLRDVAKSLILNVKCPNCGKEIQLTGD